MTIKTPLAAITIAAALLAAAVSTAQAQPPRAVDVQLATAYAAYAHVKWCHDVREGDLYQAISDADLERRRWSNRSRRNPSKPIPPSTPTACGKRDWLWRHATWTSGK